MTVELEDRLYTSTEVADVLGVSLRSIYRYLEENKLQADVKTATGRHRFSKQNILQFLYPLGNTVSQAGQSPRMQVQAAPVQQVKQEAKSEVQIKPLPTIVQEAQAVTPQETQEPVDWLAKFREAAEKYKQEAVQAVSTPAPALESPQFAQPLSSSPLQPVSHPQEVQTKYYYKSNVGGLKDIAQQLDKSARKSGVPYAFTMQAGLSLHKPIKPFSILHAYVRAQDRDLFERMLELSGSDENAAQLCLFTTDSQTIFAAAKEMHGLFVVSDLQIKKDLLDNGEEDLAAELGN